MLSISFRHPLPPSLSPCLCLFFRTCSFISPTWPIRLTEKPAHQKYHWWSFWMIFMILLPLVNLSMVLSHANTTNGNLHTCDIYLIIYNLLISVFNVDFVCIVPFSPYIIGTSNQPVKMIANHGLHLSFRFVEETYIFFSSMCCGLWITSD